MARYVQRNQYDWFSTVWKLAIFVTFILAALEAPEFSARRRRKAAGR